MPGNSNLQDSRSAKADEFYTPLSMIENELKHYKNHFKNKTVLCNCDDPRVSNFFRYFVMYFDVLELKRVIATCYKNNDADLFSQESTEKAVYLEYDGSIKYSGEEDFAKIPQEKLLEFISGLPDSQRAVFNLFCMDGYSHKEIAAALGISEATSRSQLMRARTMLQDKIRERSEEH